MDTGKMIKDRVQYIDILSRLKLPATIVILCYTTALQCKLTIKKYKRYVRKNYLLVIVIQLNLNTIQFLLSDFLIKIICGDNID